MVLKLNFFLREITGNIIIILSLLLLLLLCNIIWDGKKLLFQINQNISGKFVLGGVLFVLQNL